MVEGAGFEPAKPFRAAILQTAPINHSGTPPYTIIKARAPQPERGLEPTDLPFTKRLLSQLSYSGITFTNFCSKC